MPAQEAYYTAIPVLIMTCSVLAPWRIARVSQLILITPFIKHDTKPWSDDDNVYDDNDRDYAAICKEVETSVEGVTDVRQDDEMAVGGWRSGSRIYAER